MKSIKLRRKVGLQCSPVLQWLLYFLFAFIGCNHFVASESVPPNVKYKEVQSLAGEVAQIPCPLTSLNEVVMVLWFKGSSGAPIYSYDARNDEVEPRHLTLQKEWDLRLYFRVLVNRFPALIIKDLKPEDGGLYRCRVDYRNSPTTNSVTRLKVIEPPTKLEIRDTSKSRPISDQQLLSGRKTNEALITYLGPYSEGQNVTLICNALGGRPSPEVIWYKNGDVIDTTYYHSSSENTINEMLITNIGRNNTADIYSCLANNNNESQALTHKVILEIYLGVTSVELEIPSPMTAGTEYNIVCKTFGAYPNVKVEFWTNLKRIVSRSQMKSTADNITITSIIYKPDVIDHLQTIKCLAENPWISKKPVVARRTMKIKFTPIAILRFGRNRTSAFTEGESVLMECHVKANPPAHTILWFYQGRQLDNGKNQTADIRINGMTLFISYLSHQIGGGAWNCEGVNEVGKGISNTLSIELQLSPKCATSEVTLVPLGMGETNWLTCNVLAWPSDLNFYWTFNRSDNGVGGSEAGVGGFIRNGEIRSSGSKENRRSDSAIITKNISDHFSPSSNFLSTVAPGTNNNVTFSIGKKTNSTFKATSLPVEEKKGRKEQASQNQNGYPQLSSTGSSSAKGKEPATAESLDYPEDQHIMPYEDDGLVGENQSKDAGVETSLGNVEQEKSSQKDVSFGRESYSTDGKAILKKEGQKSMTYSSSDLVFSTSGRNFSRLNNNNNLKSSSYSSKLQSFQAGNIINNKVNDLTSSPSGKLMAGYNEEEGDPKRKETEEHRHHHHKNQRSSSIITNNNIKHEVKTRDVSTSTFTTTPTTTTTAATAKFQDKIHHSSVISYQIRNEGDYGTVACWASNSVGSQVFPCLFNIVKREDPSTKKENIDDKNHNKKMIGSPSKKSKEGGKGLENITSPGKGFQQKSETSSSSFKGTTEPQQGFSKLQKTMGIVLLVILICIAGFGGLAFATLIVLAKRRRDIQRTSNMATTSSRNVIRSRSSSTRSAFLDAFSKKQKSNSGEGASNNPVNKNSVAPAAASAHENTDEYIREKVLTKEIEMVSPFSSDMFVVNESNTISKDPFEEIAKNINIKEPQTECNSRNASPAQGGIVGDLFLLESVNKGSVAVSLCNSNNILLPSPNITTTTTTFFPNKEEKDAVANNNSNKEAVSYSPADFHQEKDIEPCSPQAISYCFSETQFECPDIGKPLKVQFAAEGNATAALEKQPTTS